MMVFPAVWHIALMGHRDDVLRELPEHPGFERMPVWAQHALLEAVRALPAKEGVLVESQGHIGDTGAQVDFNVRNVPLAVARPPVPVVVIGNGKLPAEVVEFARGERDALRVKTIEHRFDPATGLCRVRGCELRHTLVARDHLPGW